MVITSFHCSLLFSSSLILEIFPVCSFYHRLGWCFLVFCFCFVFWWVSLTNHCHLGGFNFFFLFSLGLCYDFENSIQFPVSPRFSLSPVSTCASFGLPYKDQSCSHGIETSSMFLKVSSVSCGKQFFKDIILFIPLLCFILYVLIVHLWKEIRLDILSFCQQTARLLQGPGVSPSRSLSCWVVWAAWPLCRLRFPAVFHVSALGQKNSLLFWGPCALPEWEPESSSLWSECSTWRALSCWILSCWGLALSLLTVC